MDLPPYQWRADSGYRPPKDLPVPAPTVMAYPYPHPYAVPGPIPVQAMVVPQHVAYSYPKSTASKKAPAPPPGPEKKADAAPAPPASKKDAGTDKAKSTTTKAPSKAPTKSSTHSSGTESSKPSTSSSKTAATTVKTASTKATTTSSKSNKSAAASEPKNDAAPPKKEAPRPVAPTEIKPRPASANAPHHLRAGTNYMFSTEHTTLHILSRAAKIWDAKFEGEKFTFQIYTASTILPVSQVIHNVMRAKIGDDTSKCAGWAATEVMEKGDGRWVKGSTVEFGSEKAGGTLKSMGWDQRRGNSLPPVWITVHKV